MKEQILVQDEEKFWPFTNDLLFKETFGHPDNKKYVEDLLESYFKYEKGFLKERLEVHYEKQLIKKNIEEKSKRADLLIIMDKTYKINLEMYSTFTKHSLKKSKVYGMSIHISSINSGQDYNDVERLTQINFAENISKSLQIKDELVNDISDPYYDKIDTKLVRHDIANKMSYHNTDRFIKWLKYLGAQSKIERDNIAKGDKLLMKLNEWTKQYTKEKFMNELLDDDAWTKYLEYNRGKDDGIEEGKINKQQEIIEEMLKNNYSIEEISKLLDMDIEEIQKINIDS